MTAESDGGLDTGLTTGDPGYDRGVPLWESDEERFVDYRARYLSQTTDLTEKKAVVLAWSELGYSHSGIANHIDLTERTIQGYLEELQVRYGPSAVYARLPDEKAVDADLETATPDAIDALPTATQSHWRNLAEKHAHIAPDWVAASAEGDRE